MAERHPKLRFGAIEAGIGWVPWMLAAMDEAYRKHHMWVRPKLDGLPSDYFRRQGFASFQEDEAGLDLARKHNLVDNFLWANDFPHHEGSRPRHLGHRTDDGPARRTGSGPRCSASTRRRLFRFDIPERYLHHADAAEVARRNQR